MDFNVFGNKENKAIILIHGNGISWRMWTEHIEELKNDYYIFAPVLPGHNPRKNSTFTSVEDVAAEIGKYVLNNYGKKVHAVCGASLGGTIAVEMLVQNLLKVENAIIDCGPVVKMNKILLQLGIKLRLKQIKKLKNDSSYAKKLFKNSFYPTFLKNEVVQALTNTSELTCKNVHLSVYNYSLPQSFSKSTAKIAYWYGSKEAFLAKKYAKAITTLQPESKIRIFENKGHCEVCISEPNLYTQYMKQFFAST